MDIKTTTKRQHMIHRTRRIIPKKGIDEGWSPWFCKICGKKWTDEHRMRADSFFEECTAPGSDADN